jgi:hypothetical protein
MAAAALFFLSLNVVAGSRRSNDTAPTGQMMAATRTIEDTGRQIGLPDDLSASIAWRLQTGSGTRELDRDAVLAALEGEPRR